MYPGSKVFISNGQSENHLTVFVNDETSPLTICDWKMFSYPRHEDNLGDTHWIIPNRFGLPWNILNEVGPAFLWAFIHLYPSVILFWGNHWKICSQWFGCPEGSSYSVGPILWYERRTSRNYIRLIHLLGYVLTLLRPFLLHLGRLTHNDRSYEIGRRWCLCVPIHILHLQVAWIYLLGLPPTPSMFKNLIPLCYICRDTW